MAARILHTLESRTVKHESRGGAGSPRVQCVGAVNYTRRSARCGKKRLLGCCYPTLLHQHTCQSHPVLSSEVTVYSSPHLGLDCLVLDAFSGCDEITPRPGKGGGAAPAIFGPGLGVGFPDNSALSRTSFAGPGVYGNMDDQNI